MTDADRNGATPPRQTRRLEVHPEGFSLKGQAGSKGEYQKAPEISPGPLDIRSFAYFRIRARRITKARPPKPSNSMLIGSGIR